MGRSDGRFDSSLHREVVHLRDRAAAIKNELLGLQHQIEEHDYGGYGRGAVILGQVDSACDYSLILVEKLDKLDDRLEGNSK